MIVFRSKQEGSEALGSPCDKKGLELSSEPLKNLNVNPKRTHFHLNGTPTRTKTLTCKKSITDRQCIPKKQVSGGRLDHFIHPNQKHNRTRLSLHHPTLHLKATEVMTEENHKEGQALGIQQLRCSESSSISEDGLRGLVDLPHPLLELGRNQYVRLCM